jgi:hypothetical protein
VSQEQTTGKSKQTKIPAQTRLANTYYGLLGLHPSASMPEIRRSYRQLSKKYHPDTTDLPPPVAKTKFQQLNEAYATLSNSERRSLYDLKIGYSRLNVIQVPPDWERSSQKKWSETAYLGPSERPLSAGEIFVLLLLGLTLIGCLFLAIVLAYLRGESWV